jgi:hypothetical protein
MAVLFLNDQRVGGRDTGLTHLSSVGIGVKTVVTNHDLTFIGNVRGHSLPAHTKKCKLQFTFR